MNTIMKIMFKYQAGRVIPDFTTLLLLLSFVGSNAYYITALDYLDNIQGFGNSNIFTPSPQQMAFKTSMVDVNKLFLSSPKAIELDNPMVVCDYWRKQAKKDNSWPSRLKANEECVNAILRHLVEIEGANLKETGLP